MRHFTSYPDGHPDDYTAGWRGVAGAGAGAAISVGRLQM